MTGNTSSESKEYDNPNPCSFYGLTKLEAERIVLDKEGSVIRIQTMLGVDNKIINAAVQALQDKEHVPFSIDDYVRPSYFGDFLKVLKRIYSSNLEGMFHLSCNGRAFSRYELATKFLQIWTEAGLPTKVGELKYENRKSGPRRLVLNTEYTEKTLNVTFTNSLDALTSHLRLFLHK